MSNVENSFINQLAHALQCNRSTLQDLEGLPVETIRNKIIEHYAIKNPEELIYKEASSEKKKVDRAIRYIEENFHKEINISEIAGFAHLSVFHFSRIFKKTTGRSPHQYLIKYRVDFAKKLLIETRKSINTIASETGYNNTSGFSAAFKQIEGVPPTTYRKKNSEYY